MCPAQPPALWQLGQVSAVGWELQEQQHGDRAVTVQHTGEEGTAQSPFQVLHTCRSKGRLAPGPLPSDPAGSIQVCPVKMAKQEFCWPHIQHIEENSPACHRKPPPQSCCGNCTGMDPTYQDSRSQNLRLAWGWKRF